MFESLQDRLGSILNGLTGRGTLSDGDVQAALREVRRALLEADVSLEVVRSFTDRVRAKAVGAQIVKSIKPGQMVVKIVHDELVETLGSDAVAIDLNAPAPVTIMMVGLQGSGKTTTTAKIAKRLTERQPARRGDADPHAGEAAGPDIDQDARRPPAARQFGDHRHQPLGMAAADLLIARLDYPPACDQRDRTGGGGGLDDQRVGLHGDGRPVVRH